MCGIIPTFPLTSLDRYACPFLLYGILFPCRHFFSADLYGKPFPVILYHKIRQIAIDVSFDKSVLTNVFRWCKIKIWKIHICQEVSAWTKNQCTNSHTAYSFFQQSLENAVRAVSSIQQCRSQQHPPAKGHR